MELSKAITHVRQTGDWDCGLACVHMILGSSVRLPPQAPRAVWTVDLAYMLHSHGVKFKYTTITLGANLDYSNIAFYASVHQDAARVNALFENAAQAGITIEKKSATKEELIAHVKGGGACLVLVDMNYLVCNKCAPRWWKRSAERVLPPSSYRGHYIILIEWNESKEEFAFRDPDRADGALVAFVTISSVAGHTADRLQPEIVRLIRPTDTCYVSASQLETARKRTGTDEDIIWVEARHSTAGSAPPATPVSL